jgi:hypothetical protein
MLDDAQEVTRSVYLWYVLTSPQSSLYPELRHNCDIQILLEYTWMIPKVGKDQIIKGHLAWANGDTTGTLNLPSSRSGALLTIDLACRSRLWNARGFRQWASQIQTIYAWLVNLPQEFAIMTVGGISPF